MTSIALSVLSLSARLFGFCCDVMFVMLSYKIRTTTALGF